MRPEEKDLTLIEKYFRNELNAQERKEVEVRRQSDAAFHEKMQWHEDFMDVVREERNQEIKSFLKEEEKRFIKTENNNNTNTSSKIIQINWIRWAAAVLVLGAVTWLIWSSLSFDSQKIYATHFTPYPNDLVSIERAAAPSSAEDDPLKKAFIAYQNNEFDKAVRQFDQLLASTSSDSLLFFKAVALLSKGDTELAINILEELNKKEDWRYNEAVRWYLALSYLKLQQTDQARSLLEQIVNQEGGHFQQSSAKEILEKY